MWITALALSFERYTAKTEATTSLRDSRENHAAFCCKSTDKFMPLHVLWGVRCKFMNEED